MKKLLSILLFGYILLGLTACSVPKPSSSTTPDPMVIPEPTATPKPVTVVKGSPSPQTETAADDLLKDGDFTNGVSDEYYLYLEEGDAEVSWENGEVAVHISYWGKKPYSVQFNRNGFNLQQGTAYRLTFDVRSTVSRSMEVCVQKQGGDWDVLFQEEAEAGTDTQHQEMDFTVPSSGPAQISINMGLVGDPPDVYEEHWVYLDNLQLLDLGKATQESAVPKATETLEPTPEPESLSAWEDFSWNTRRYRGYSVDLTDVYDGNVDIWFGDAASVELTFDGEATLLWEDGTEDYLDENVLMIFPVAYGNGGMGAIFMVLEDGSIDLVNPSAMTRHEVRMTYNLGGLKGITDISRGTTGDQLGRVVARDVNGNEYVLDNYIIPD